MYEIDSHSKEFDKDFKRLARYNRVLARELMELIADELMPNGRVPDSYRPHVLDNPGGLYNGCMEFHLADDVLVLLLSAGAARRDTPEGYPYSRGAVHGTVFQGMAKESI